MNNLPLSPDVISFANFNTGTTAKNTSAKLVPWPSRFAIFFFAFIRLWSRQWKRQPLIQIEGNRDFVQDIIMFIEFLVKENSALRENVSRAIFSSLSLERNTVLLYILTVISRIRYKF